MLPTLRQRGDSRQGRELSFATTFSRIWSPANVTPIRTECSFLLFKTADAWIWPLTSLVSRLGMRGGIFHSSTRLHGLTERRTKSPFTFTTTTFVRSLKIRNFDKGRKCAHSDLFWLTSWAVACPAPDTVKHTRASNTVKSQAWKRLRPFHGVGVWNTKDGSRRHVLQITAATRRVSL
jgi:hypothetical protein